jgi:hypothetical protein
MKREREEQQAETPDEKGQCPDPGHEDSFQEEADEISSASIDFQLKAKKDDLQLRNRLARRVGAVEQSITGAAREALDPQATTRRFRANFVHQAEMAVGRAVELKHDLAAESAILPPAHDRFRHDETNPEAKQRAPTGWRE